jgi:hypothetical protein
MTRRFVVLALAAVACAPAARTPAGPAAAPAAGPFVAPAADELRRDLFAFAADSFRGRETGTPDGDRAARFLAARLASLGVEAAGDSGYFQRVPLQRERFAAGSRAQLTSPAGTTPLRLGPDRGVVPALGGAAPLPLLSADADVLFGSYGLVDPATGRNDYAGVDAAGKVVVVVNDVPPGVTDPAARRRLGGIGGIQARLEQAIPRRPAAVIILVADSLYGDVAAQFSSPVTPGSDAPQAAPGPRTLPMIAVAPLRAGSPFLPTDWPTNRRARPLSRTRFTAALTTERETFNAYNVVGVVRGSDPALRGTYVAYGAHYDHIGILPPVNGDSIANGADDDGSGTTALLAIARAYQQGPRPRRSLLFVWHTGEEKGLFGSARFVDRPTVPLDSVVAQLNADMIGRNAADSLYVVGPAAAPRGQSRRLGAVVDSVNSAGTRPFAFNREWDNPTHPEQIYFRSDHYNYARKGVPIVFFTTGLHDDYHKASDEPNKIDYDKLARVSRLLYDVGTAVANNPERPVAPGAAAQPATTP